MPIFWPFLPLAFSQQADVEYMDWPCQPPQVAINFWAALWFGWPSVPECSDRSRSYLCKSFLGGIAAWNVCVAMCIRWIKPLVWTRPVNLSPFWDSYSYLTLLKHRDWYLALLQTDSCDMLLLLLVVEKQSLLRSGLRTLIPATISLQALDSASAVHIQRMKVGYDLWHLWHLWFIPKTDDRWWSDSPTFGWNMMTWYEMWIQKVFAWQIGNISVWSFQFRMFFTRLKQVPAFQGFGMYRPSLSLARSPPGIRICQKMGHLQLRWAIIMFPTSSLY